MPAAQKFNGFVFNGPKLDDIDLPRIGRKIGVGEDVIHGVMDVEAAGSGVDRKGRLKALYEPHVAYRNAPTKTIRDKLVAAGLAYPKWKKSYPADSYPRILKAMEIDETTALKATSWAGYQILGENHVLAGYDTVQEMVLDYLKDEENQLESCISFIKNAGLDDELRTIEKKLRAGKKVTPDDCRPFVRGYNGAGYEQNGYHTKLAKAINNWARIPDTKFPGISALPESVPVPTVRPKTGEELFGDGKVHEELEGIQQMLNDKGYPEVGAIDGKWGTKSRAAILAFRADEGLPTGQAWIDADFFAKLALSKGREIAPARANATMADLRAEGAEDVKAADVTQIVGSVAGAGGVLGAITKATESFENYGGLVKRVSDVLDPIQGFITDNFWLLLIGIGGVVVWQSGVLKNIRLAKHQKAEDVSL